MKLAGAEVSVCAHLSLVISLHQPNASYTSPEVESQHQQPVVTCAALSGPAVLPLSLLTPDSPVLSLPSLTRCWELVSEEVWLPPGLCGGREESASGERTEGSYDWKKVDIQSIRPPPDAKVEARNRTPSVRRARVACLQFLLITTAFNINVDSKLKKWNITELRL